MSDFALHTNPVNIEDEMKRSYMDYAMSVIVGRALPDARDGLGTIGGVEHQLRRTVFQTVHPDWKSGLQNTKSFFLAPII